jgi:hypothetical protein
MLSVQLNPTFFLLIYKYYVDILGYNQTAYSYFLLLEILYLIPFIASLIILFVFVIHHIKDVNDNSLNMTFE